LLSHTQDFVFASIYKNIYKRCMSSWMTKTESRASSLDEDVTNI